MGGRRGVCVRPHHDSRLKCIIHLDVTEAVKGDSVQC